MRKDRFGLVDTSEWAEKTMIELMRSKTPEERFLMTMKRMDFMRELRKATADLRDCDGG